MKIVMVRVVDVVVAISGVVVMDVVVVLLVLLFR